MSDKPKKVVVELDGCLVAVLIFAILCFTAKYAC